MIKQMLGLVLSLVLSACSAQSNFDNVDLNAEEFQVKMDEKNVVVLDVRTPKEVAMGKIEGAVVIDFRANDFNQQIQVLDKEKTYLVYCASGGRSSKTCNMMLKNGFESVHNLLGGFKAWESKNNTTE